MLLQLYESGQVSLEDTIGKYVSGVPNGDTATLRHLMSRSTWINEASLTFQRFSWNTLPTNFDLIGIGWQYRW